MLKDITLGQFFPGTSLAHRLDPRTKILLTVVYIVALFCAESFVSYGIMVALLITGVKVSGVAPKALVRGLKPVLFIICFTAVLNLFYTPGEVLAQFWIFKVTREGIFTAFFMALRISMLIMGTFLLTYTTSPIALTDALESLLGPLKKVKVPVHELSMMMSIALRFIPTLIEETDKIMSAQKARGADFESGSLLDRAKALVPILVPLFISAFRRADELAVAMECRCYHGGQGRTKLHVLRYQQRDHSLGPLEDISGFKVRAPGLLGGHDLVRLLDQGGDKAQGNGHHHGQLVDRHMDLLQRAQQALQPVCQADGAGGIGQKERPHDEHGNAQHHEEGGLNALDGDLEDPPPPDLRARGIKQVQNRGKGDDEQHRLQPPHQGPGRHSGNGHTGDQHRRHQRIGHEPLCQEQGGDVYHDQDQLRSGVQLVGNGISGEILAQGDILQHGAPPFRRAVRER